DRCSHRGAPLHEGELRRGEPCEGEPSGDDPGEGCLVCPWHGSVFATDGSVVSGPATRPQSRYDVRIRAGRVWVARSGETRSLRLNPVGR
ncbi:MAG TPA: Rieske (2Fe-2S) protein, partial [Microlunatus sp.]|nr:Rieske (2Fe-2S) protein [Microlunatus sp.]